MAKKEEMRRHEVDGRGWSPVNDVGGGVECLNPKQGWEVRVDEKDTENVVGGADKALGLAVLWRGVWAR